ncbi:CRISPR-associated endonuclease Cas2 [Coprothermobacteraceae bacterium]|nr:CRISPR-associated endonuclease Cas2 [Coprothermobacteraceae bacterium]
MYIIAVYDVNEERVSKVLKVFRKYLTWVQNSVFEGEISESKFQKLKSDLREVIREDEDSVLFYSFREVYYTRRETMGKPKNEPSSFI